MVQGQRWWLVGCVQDDIKWKPNLTINAGLRYEFYTVPKEKDGRDKVWRISCGGFCAPGTRWYEPDYNNFGPRVGFAWTPARFNDNTVIRGGFGVFFGPGQNDDVFAPIDNAGARTTLTRSEAGGIPRQPGTPHARPQLCERDRSGHRPAASRAQLAGDSEYHVYPREGAPGAPHDHSQEIAVVRGGADSTDGIEISSSPLGPRLPRGGMIAMNSGPRNFLVFNWQDVAAALRTGR